MRSQLTIIAVLVAAAALGATVWLVNDDSGRGGGEGLTPPGSGKDDVGDDAGDASIPAGGGPGREATSRPQETPPPQAEGPAGESPEEAYARHVRDRDEASFWRRCMGAADNDQIRDCMQRDLAGRDMSAADLAALVCGEAPPDGADRMLIEEVASLWDPAIAGSRMVEFHGMCNAPGVVWRDFIKLQLERDPEWVEIFAESVDAESFFGGDGILMLQALDAVAAGAPDLRALLEGGARGEFGGSDEQVAYAIDRSLALYDESKGKLEFLKSVIASPDFQGGPSAVRAVVRAALSASGNDSGQVIDLLDALLDDALTSAGAAEHIMSLHRINRMPQWMAESDRQQLVQKAENVLR